ncbi:hypothetical protein ID866_7207 [Astraeus odoratus]|nr:hypothetical protein ID866_7207 [Astraeus odoratus]
MAPVNKHIFFTGATGYVGGTVLSRLIEHPTYETTEISVLIRPSKKDKITVLESLGLKPVFGTYDDLELLENQASKSDIVIACADADNLPATEAILKGLRKRYETTGTQPLLIHTSGSGILIDDAKGLYATDVIYDDLNPDQIETIPPTQPHRGVDLVVLRADDDCYIKSFIILPSTIYGHAKTKLVDLGIQNPRSIQIPQFIRAGLVKGQGGMVGKGENIWTNVHIDDIADLFIVVYENALSEKAAHGREGLYFGENGEHKLYDVAKAISQTLFELGRGRSPEPESFTEEDYERPEISGIYFPGTNSRCRGRRGRLLGWDPKYTTEDLLKSIKPEVESMAPVDKHTFLTGATGYIGGTVLSRLIEHPTYETTEISVLIRPSKKDKIPVLESLGLKPVLGTYDDLELLKDEASKADIVIACADADNLPAAEAILRGMRKRHENTGTQPLLIHTSGAGILVDDARGMYPTDIIYDDLNLDQIESLAPTQPHRDVDLTILQADKDNYIKSFIVHPCTIYAHSKTKLVDLGIQNPRSIQIPQLIRAGLIKGQGGMVGKGENIWPNVHIDDMADLFIVVYENALSGKAAHGREGLYFGENGEHKLYDVAKAISQILYQLGKGKSPEPESFTEEDYKRPEIKGLDFPGTNSRFRGKRGRLLGWNPKYTTEDLFKSIKPEVEYMIKHERF